MGTEGVWAMVRGKKWKFSRRCSSLWFFTALQTSVSSTLTSHALQSRLGRQMVASILQPPFINFSVVFSDTREVHVNPGCINFLNKKDPWFKQLHGTLDVSSIDYIQRDWAWRWKVQVFSSRKMSMSQVFYRQQIQSIHKVVGVARCCRLLVGGASLEIWALPWYSQSIHTCQGQGKTDWTNKHGFRRFVASLWHQ